MVLDMSEMFLQVRDLAKHFGKTEALRGVSFDVQHDELLVVLGATRAGKTTLLRTIAGLETPASGSIMMAGDDITRTAPRRGMWRWCFRTFRFIRIGPCGRTSSFRCAHRAGI